MMKVRILSCCSLILLGAVSIHAQTTVPAKPEDAAEKGKNVRGFWQATLPGGGYSVGIDKITSVSRHSYLLDGALMVDEVTIDTTGQALARFYFITPVGAAVATSAGSVAPPLERAQGLFDSAGKPTGIDSETMVIKKYPETTHARTIEYRLASAAELTALFTSAREAWQSGRGGQFSLQAK